MSVNKVILVGNVGKDPEIKYIEKGLAVANFRLATTDRAKVLKDGTQIPEHTEWHRIEAWRGLAQFVEKYIKKGTALYVEGKLRTREWSDVDGRQHFVTDIVAEDLQFVGARKEMKDETVPQESANVTEKVPELKATDEVPKVEDDGLPF